MTIPEQYRKRLEERADDFFRVSPRGFVNSIPSAWECYLAGAEATWALARESEREVLKSILSEIDRSGVEGVYNWGAPLRAIRAIVDSRLREMGAGE